jgi:hypothetical protein
MPVLRHKGGLLLYNKLLNISVSLLTQLSEHSMKVTSFVAFAMVQTYVVVLAAVTQLHLK